MFQKVLVCTDFTDGLQRLVHFVPQLAASGIQQITFLHVLPLDSDRSIPKPDPEKERQARNRLTVDPAAGGVEIRVEVQWGRPVDAILHFAQAGAADLILMGTPIRSLLAEKLFGSTLVSVCQRSAVPVMLFRPQLLSVYTNEELALRCKHLFRYLLAPYDSSRAAEYLVQQIRQRAQADGNVLEQCLLTWAITEGGRRDLPKDYQVEEAKTRLAAAKTTLESANLTVETQILRGEPIPEILLAAIDYDISAIAISSERFGKLSELSAPSFAGELLRRSGHPIIYFPCRPGSG